MKKLDFKHTFLSCYIGAFVQATVCGFTPLLFVIFGREYGISLSLITIIATLNFLFQLAADTASIFLVEKIGYRKIGIAAYFLSAAGLFSLGAIAPLFESIYPMVLVSVILFSIGGGLLEVMLSPIVEGSPSDNKTSKMSFLHSMFGFGSAAMILITTIFLKIFGWKSWRMISIIWGLLPLLNGIYFLFVPLGSTVKDGKAMPIRSLFSDKRFWGFILIMAAGGAAEIGMSQWASAFAESSLGISKAAGDVLGPCAFALMLAFARIGHSKLAHSLDLYSLIIGSGVLAILCYLVAALSPVPMLSLIACGLCGFAVGILWPGTLSLASGAYPLGGGTLFAVMAFAGDIGCTLGPSTVGFAASYFGGNLKTGLLIGAIFPLVLVVGLLFLKDKKTTE